jgi:hypothetical protein
VNTVYRTSIDRLLDNGFCVSVLIENPRAAIIGFDIKSVRGHMGAVLTTNAGHLVHINPFLTPGPPQFWLKARTVVATALGSSQLRF